MNKHGVKSSANSLRNLAGMLSGLAAFDGSRSCKSLVIPKACKSINACPLCLINFCVKHFKDVEQEYLW